jgi:hypothetical protein
MESGSRSTEAGALANFAGIVFVRICGAIRAAYGGDREST